MLARMSLVVLVIALALVPRPAHADVTGQLYDDVRDVVEELIQTEVTTSVVSVVEKKSPALAFYMHGTLERLGSPYWGSLSRVLKDDLTIAVADFVYWHLSTGGGDGDIVASAKRFFGCVSDARADDGCRRLIAAVHDQHRPLIEVECRRSKPPPERRVACDIGLATKAALERRGSVRHHIVDALADIVLSEVDDRGLADRLRDVLLKWLDLPKDLPTPLLEALANPDLSDQLTDAAIDELCKDPKTLDEFFRDQTGGRAWICFAVTHPALPSALAARLAINDGSNTLETTIDFWVIEAALKDYDADRASDDSAFRLLADIAFDARCPAGEAATHQAWPCKGARLGTGATITVQWQGRELTGTVDAGGQIASKPAHQMQGTLMRFSKAIHRIEELRALVPPAMQTYIFYAGSTPAPSRKVLRSALDIHLGETGRPREKFFLTLAAYLLDSNEGVGEQVARSAFRAAAKDLLLSETHVGVPRVGDRVRLRVMPRLAMKLSFNDTYAVTDGDSRRVVVSADWPTLMVAVTDYAGLEASILDPIAPLSEMALRPAGSYHEYSFVALDIIRPRLGAWVAVPQLSRRLALTAGFGARFLDVKRDTTMPGIDATYGAKASLTFDAGIEFVF